VARSRSSGFAANLKNRIRCNSSSDAIISSFQQTATASSFMQRHGNNGVDQPFSSLQKACLSPVSSNERQPPPCLVLTPVDKDQRSSSVSSSTASRGTLLMLHGWAQNTHIFANRSKKLVKRVQQAGYKVVFLQAPHRLPPKKTEDSIREGVGSSFTEPPLLRSREYAYAWFLYGAVTTTPIPSLTGDYAGMNQSLELIAKELHRLKAESPKAPIFLLGFSQGAVMVHKIATLTCDPTSPSFWRCIEKCILVSGFPFRTTAPDGKEESDNNSSLNTLLTMPSLHVIGKSDSRISPPLTRQVYLQEPCFHDRFSVWEHERGHVVPTDQSFCIYLLEFLASKE
jgi:predicted esterase